MKDSTDRGGLWILLAVFVFAASFITFAVTTYHRSLLRATSQCEANGGELVITGRGNGNWVCVDPRILR